MERTLVTASRTHVYVRASFLVLPLAIVFPMVLRWLGRIDWAKAVELPFSVVCHRLPERTLVFSGAPMPICSRCAGMWMGFAFAAALAMPHFSIKRLRLIVLGAGLLLLLDVLAQDFGLHPFSHVTRFITGALFAIPFGGTLGHLITRELRDGAPAIEGAPR